jgi:hypothetical protein
MLPSLSTMVTDGANRVGERGADAPLSHAGFIAAVGFTALALRMPGARAVRVAAFTAAAAMALPGLSTIAGQRSDSPARAAAAAATIERFRDRIEAFSDARGCARVVASSCAACEPVVDFALATSRACEVPAPIVLGPDSLSAGCTQAGATLTCGRESTP